MTISDLRICYKLVFSETASDEHPPIRFDRLDEPRGDATGKSRRAARPVRPSAGANQWPWSSWSRLEIAKGRWVALYHVVAPAAGDEGVAADYSGSSASGC